MSPATKPSASSIDSRSSSAKSRSADGGTKAADNAKASPGSPGQPSPVDWDFAEWIAVRTSGASDFAGSPEALSMSRQLDSLTHEAQTLVEDFCELRSRAGTAKAEVIDRKTWIQRNIAGFRHIIDPLADKMSISSHVSERRPLGLLSQAGRTVSSKVLGLELGIVLGVLSQRVLGQYDLLLAEEASEDSDEGPSTPGGVVYYVGPNIMRLEKTHGFSVRDFRFWIALHEVTHRTQFTAVDWLRPYFLGLVDEGLGGFQMDTDHVAEAAKSAFDRIKSGKNPISDDGIVSLFISPEQKKSISKVQALMTLLEGHGNYVMDSLGADHVHGQAYMSRVLRERRQQGGFAKLVLRLIGMEMKMRQYEEGQKFINSVDARLGIRGLDPAWLAEENLPTLEELRGGADSWIERIYGDDPEAAVKATPAKSTSTATKAPAKTPAKTAAKAPAKTRVKPKLASTTTPTTSRRKKSDEDQ